MTRDIRDAQGALLLPASFCMLEEQPNLTWSFLPPAPANTELAGIDALFHFGQSLGRVELDAAAERLLLIARHGVGLDMVDIGACTENGIAITTTPDGIARPMASAAVCLILALSHRLGARDTVVRRGGWEEGRLAMVGYGLAGRTLGLIGFGAIGREIRQLIEPWDMDVIVCTRRPLSVETQTHNKVRAVELDELFGQSDVVVVACPLTDQTRHLVNSRRLSLLKRGALLVNVARGGVVDSVALAEALSDGQVAGAGLDVFEHEPPGALDPLLSAPNTLLAPHSLGYTDELFRGCVASASRSILAVLDGRVPDHVANPEVLDDRRFIDKLDRWRNVVTATC